MCDRKVLYAMRRMSCMLLCDMYVLYMLCVLSTGRSRDYGPEGQEVTERKVDAGRTGRSTGIWDGGP